MKKGLTFFPAIALAMTLLTGCGSSDQKNEAPADHASAEKKELNIGATAGPYSDMVTKAITPIMEQKGYKIKVTEFSDYVQPNLALANGSLDANLFQHVIYLHKFAQDKNLDIKEVVSVPTAPMGVYSNKFKSVDEIAEGASIAVPNDPTNMARALFILKDMGLVTLKDGIDPAKASEKDIAENKKNLKIQPIEAAQLPRAVEGTDLAAVPGNFALAAKMDLTKALVLEKLAEDYHNVLAVKTADLDAPFAKDLKAAIESPEFEKAIDEQFKGFDKPQWMRK